MKLKILLFFAAALMYNCGKTFMLPPGPHDDTIKLSADTHSFSKEGGMFTVTTEGTFWWLTECEVDSLYYYSHCLDGNTHADYGDIVMYCDSYSRQNQFELSKIESSWFSIAKETSQKIVFTVLPNETGKTRRIKLHLQAGNYFTCIDVNQSPK